MSNLVDRQSFNFEMKLKAKRGVVAIRIARKTLVTLSSIEEMIERHSVGGR